MRRLLLLATLTLAGCATTASQSQSGTASQGGRARRSKAPDVAAELSYVQAQVAVMLTKLQRGDGTKARVFHTLARERLDRLALVADGEPTYPVLVAALGDAEPLIRELEL